ncbi:MAG: SH3 domain-containing protein [Peptococcales bacterium]|jgi:nucleoid-associated protein YgaU
MYMYLTEVPAGSRLQIPILPDRLNVRTNATTIASNIINVGEVKIPRGTSLTGYSWSGELPGEHMRNYPFVAAWQPPRQIIETLRTWMTNNQVLNFMLTEATINEEVFIEALSYEHKPNGNIGYNITLTARRALTIKTVPAPPAPPKSTGTAGAAKQYGRVRLSNPNGTAPVLREPKAGARTMGYIRHNEQVEILGTSGNYYRIPYQGSTGYVLRRYITLETTTTPTKATSRTGGSRTGLTEIRTTIADPKTTTYTANPFETIADIARRTYGSNTAVKNIINANKPALQKIAKTAKTIVGKLKAGIKLIIPKATKPPVKRPIRGGGGSRNVMLK